MSVAQLESAEIQLEAPSGLWSDAWRRLIRNPGALVGFGLVTLFVLTAIFAPLIAPYDPRETDVSLVTDGCCPGPSAEHWFGVDQLGRDEFSRVVYGARFSLLIGVVAVSVGVSIGLLLGSMSGFFGGKTDSVIMRLMDIMLSIPGLLMAIGIAAMLGPGLFSIMIAIGVVNVPIFARLLRGSVLGQKGNDFVLAARAIGVPRRTILVSHILPNAISPIIVAAHARARDRDHRRGRARLPRARPSGSLHARVGNDAHGHRQVPPDGTAPGDHPRHRDRDLGARLQPHRRRSARGPRPEAQRTLTVPEPLLSVEDLKVEFWTSRGTVYAVNGISFEVAAGETLGIVGESGCGKSVTSLALLGILSRAGRVTGGTATFGGRDLLKLDDQQLRKIRGREIAMIFQDPMSSLNPVLTVGRQIREALEIHFDMERGPANRRAAELLEQVGIPSARQRLGDYPHQFSGGMRQRAMIAMALACEPKLLIADEPTTALDVTIQAQILDLLRELVSERDTSMILITHDLGVVAGICERVHVMYAGTFVETGSVDQVFAAPQHPYTYGLLRSVPRLDTARRQALQPIAGSPRNMLSPPDSCPFAPRCPNRIQVCDEVLPQLEPVEPGHRIACFNPVAADEWQRQLEGVA